MALLNRASKHVWLRMTLAEIVLCAMFFYKANKTTGGNGVNGDAKRYAAHTVDATADAMKTDARLKKITLGSFGDGHRRPGFIPGALTRTYPLFLPGCRAICLFFILLPAAARSGNNQGLIYENGTNAHLAFVFCLPALWLYSASLCHSLVLVFFVQLFVSFAKETSSIKQQLQKSKYISTK